MYYHGFKYKKYFPLGIETFGDQSQPLNFQCSSSDMWERRSLTFH